MKKVYLLSSLGLGLLTTLALIYSINYVYPGAEVLKVDSKWVPKNTESSDSEEIIKKNYELIHEKNIFDINRGKEDPNSEEVPEQVADTSKYSFELRGINIVGNVKVALLTATQTGGASGGRTSSRSRSENEAPDPNAPSAPARSVNASKVLSVVEGGEIEKTGYKVAEIKSGQVIIHDRAGKALPPLVFNLLSASSLKRAELAFNEEMKRQKEVQKEIQSEMNPNPQTGIDGKKPTDTTPKVLTREEREREVRRKSEELREEMLKLRSEELKAREEKDKHHKEKDNSTSTNQ